MMKCSAAVLLVHLCYQLVEVSFGCSLADVRTVNAKGTPTTGAGYLQVCQQQNDGSSNDWVLVCAEDDSDFEQTNIGAVNAACRQMGYLKSISSTSKTMWPKQYNNAILYIDCPIVGNYSSDGELLLMRCSHGELVNLTSPNETRCGGILFVYCDVNSPLNDADPYNGQVQLVDDGNEDLKKTLKLFTSKDKNPGEWGYVCAKEEVMDEVILNTICRQLGFTGYEDYKAQPYSPYSGPHWQIEGGFNCHCTCPSLPCITSCWNPESISKVDHCGPGYQYVTLSCKFVEVNATVYGAGSRALCGHQTDFSCNFPYSPDSVVAAFWALPILLILSFGFNITLLLIVCKLYKYRSNAGGEMPRPSSAEVREFNNQEPPKGYGAVNSQENP